jgi:hypothetical protein
LRIPLMKYIASYLACAMFIIGIAPRVDAAFAPSEVIALSQTDRAADLAVVQKVLELKMVKERFSKLGLTQDEIQGRLSQLSDQQLHKLALRLDSVEAGGDSGLGIVIAILIIAILVVLLIQLTGHRVIVR